MFKTIKNSAGFTIIESLVALVVVSITILAVAAVTSGYLKVAMKTQEKLEIPGVQSDLLNRARMVLLDTVDGNGKRTQGICAIISPKERRPGIVEVDVLTTREALGHFDNRRFTKYLTPGWEIDKLTVANGSIKGLLNSTSSGVGGRDDSSILGKVSAEMDIQMVSLDPSKGTKVFEPLTSSTVRMDSKKVAFMISVYTTYKQKSSDSSEPVSTTEEAKEFVSVIDIGACDTTDANGQALYISPAGTGLGDPTSRTIYNNSLFSAVEQDPFTFQMSATEITRGKFIRNQLSADRDGNVVAACTETTFRCKQSGAARSYQDAVTLTTNVNYHANNRYGYRERVRIRPEMSIRNIAGGDVIKSRAGVRMSHTTHTQLEYGPAADQNWYALTASGQPATDSPMQLVDGPNRVFSRIWGMEPYCRDLCKPDAPAKNWIEIMLTTPDIRVDEAMYQASAQSQMPVHCTMCYLKSCKRMGLNTFGPRETLPDEPLDANVPECEINFASNNKIIQKPELRRDDATGCIAGSISSGGPSLARASCSEAKPILCFAFGKYTMAKNAQGNVITGTQASAEAACRAMGQESFTANAIRELFAQQQQPTDSLSTLPTGDGGINFINYAKAGSFVYPGSSEGESKMVSDLIERGSGYSSGSSFWVPLQYDQLGLVSTQPMATMARSLRHLIYFNSAGQATHSRLPASQYSAVQDASADMAYVAVHAAGTRGLLRANKVQAEAKEFLCFHRTNHKFFIPDVISRNFADGGQICESANGYFIAPWTPLQWSQALNEVSAIAGLLPFPHPTTGDVNRAVWVNAHGSDREHHAQGEFARFKSSRNVPEPVTEEVPPTEPGGEPTTRVVRTYSLSSNLVDANGVYIVVASDQAKSARFACLDLSSERISLSSSSNCGENRIRVDRNNITHPRIGLIWLLSKGNFGLRSDEGIQI